MDLKFNIHNAVFGKDGLAQVKVESAPLLSSSLESINIIFMAENDPYYIYGFNGHKLVITQNQIALHRGRGKRTIKMDLKKPCQIWGADKLIFTPYYIKAIRKGRKIFEFAD